jgi:hypothetical protein
MAYTTIKKPSEYFNTNLYSGNSSTQSLTGVNFQPDFTWIKERNGVEHHYLFDAVRGVTNFIYSNLSNGEASNANSLTAFDSDGFSLGNYADINESGKTYASWNWKADGTAVSNTDGDITSSVSANTTSGFSIVSWTGTGATATVGHGLGVAPSVIIPKNRTDTGTDWYTYWKALGNTNAIRLNTTGASAATGIWNNTSPTSSVFSVIDNPVCNASGKSYIAYCFAEIKGFSKFGSYTGNNSSDGPFIYTGFKPAWVLIKQTNSSNIWELFDNKRSPFNLVDDYLSPDTSDAETTGSSQNLDFLSNGFKPRSSGSGLNGSGSSYIYMAFAEQPLVGDNPATAR